MNGLSENRLGFSIDIDAGHIHQLIFLLSNLNNQCKRRVGRSVIRG